MFDQRVYLIMEQGKAWYSIVPSEEHDCWSIELEFIGEWLVNYPELFIPQTIH